MESNHRDGTVGRKNKVTKQSHKAIRGMLFRFVIFTPLTNNFELLWQNV